MMDAVIMAGGKGTRLGPLVAEIPKPMMPIAGKPILEYQIKSLMKSGIDKVTMMIGHLGSIIQEYFQDGEKWGIKIDYIIEDEPLGTAGALYHLKDKFSDDFLLIFGDLVLDIDWDRFMDFHKRKGGLITLYGHPNEHPYDSDIIIMDHDRKVKRIEPKNRKRGFYYHNFVNAGVYCIDSKILDNLSAPVKLDLEKDVIAKQIEKGMVYAYRSTEYVKDMGTPDRLDTVKKDMMSGIVKSRNLKNRQRAVFLDRDGTINVLKGFLSDAKDLELLGTAAMAIKKLNASQYLTIVATNQPVIARGECTMEALEDIHMKLETLLGSSGSYVDDIFYCPHHPHKGFEGEVSELKIDCECRKPKIGMLIKAAEQYNIDLSESWYIGDTTVDIQTGKNAGMRTILVKTGEAGSDGRYDVKPDHEAGDLLEAVDIILKRSPS